jgi:glucosamine 6-phosphate synthetase-like amidotransferase/phosphosugar isomerase protein
VGEKLTAQGIIENYAALREMLLKKGYTCWKFGLSR